VAVDLVAELKLGVIKVIQTHVCPGLPTAGAAL
jgi:hypothetical protein